MARAPGGFCYGAWMRPAVDAKRPGGWLWPALLLFLAPGGARAADEIQVYNAEINRPGQFSLQLHGNYVPRGRTAAAFPGGMVPDRAFNGTPEFALGITECWEIGAYLPYAVTRGGDFETGGGKLRTLVASPHAHDRPFFYGVNFELSDQPRLFEANHWGSEIRPIIGWRRPPIEFIVNPIVDVVLRDEIRDQRLRRYQAVGQEDKAKLLDDHGDLDVLQYMKSTPLRPPVTDQRAIGLCVECGGHGACSMCGGHGMSLSGECPLCTGTGVCRGCNGTGLIERTDQ